MRLEPREQRGARRNPVSYAAREAGEAGLSGVIIPFGLFAEATGSRRRV